MMVESSKLLSPGGRKGGRQLAPRQLCRSCNCSRLGTECKGVGCSKLKKNLGIEGGSTLIEVIFTTSFDLSHVNCGSDWWIQRYEVAELGWN